MIVKRIIKKLSKVLRGINQYLLQKNNYISYDKAIELLDSFSPNPNTSCYVQNGGEKEENNILYDLSVIIPSYNCENTIKRCIDSVIKQTTSYSFQVIVINDGSQDNTKSILSEYEKLDNCVIINQQNMGFSGARNTGLDICNGKYIMFVDADDRLTENAIDNLMKVAFEYDADVVAGNYRNTNINGEVISVASKYENQKIEPMGYLHGQPWGKVYKSHIFDDLRFPEGYWYEDSIFAQIVWPSVKKVYTISNYVYEYTFNPNGITVNGQSKPKAIDSLYITIKLLDDKKKFNLKLNNLDYEYFLRMVKLTYNRTGGLNSAVVKSIFVVESELIKKFEGLQCNNRRLLPLEKALLEKNYKLYIRSVIF